MCGMLSELVAKTQNLEWSKTQVIHYVQVLAAEILLAVELLWACLQFLLTFLSYVRLENQGYRP